MDASGFGRGYGVTGAQTSLRRADDRGNMKWWCRFPKNRNLHHHFQRLRASAAGAGVNLPVERSLNRCGPVKRGACYRKRKNCTTKYDPDPRILPEGPDPHRSPARCLKCRLKHCRIGGIRVMIKEKFAMIESELKASLEGIDMDELRGRIQGLGFTFKAKKRETDVYFNGAAAAGVQSGSPAVGGNGSPVSRKNGSPAGREGGSPAVGEDKAAVCGRDFRKTDEALRVRTVKYEDGGTKSFITYKGPKQDMNSMTRTELQTDIGSGETAEAVFRALGYEPVFTVSKTREQYWNRDLLLDPLLDRNWNPVTKHVMTLCLDDVDGLGRFLEIEIMVADRKGVGAARANLHQMLDVLMIPQDNATTVSYLEQLMRR